MKQYPTEITEAIRLFKENKLVQSRDSIRNYICEQCNQMDALLWLAKVSPDQNEAAHAAELAYYLDPENEIAKRAVAGVHERFTKSPNFEPRLELIKLTGMSQSQSRIVNWPFRGLQKPIGVLLDDGTITARDLAWAAQNATDPYIRQASRTILLSTLLEGKVESSDPARVIQGIEYSQFQLHLATLWAGIGVGTLFTFIFFIVGFDLLSLIFKFVPPLIANIISIVTIPMAIGFYFYGNRAATRIENFRAGQKGEGKTLDILKASLPRPWVIIHNLSWVNRKWGDIDFVLIGPGGVWVLEVKSFTSQMRVSGNRWEYKSRFGWKNSNSHPGKQAQRNAVRLRDYLNQKGINPGWVQPVVIWAGDEHLLTIEDAEIPVWRIGDIPNRIEDLWQQRKLKDEQIEEITKLLELVVEDFRAKWK